MIFETLQHGILDFRTRVPVPWVPYDFLFCFFFLDKRFSVLLIGMGSAIAHGENSMMPSVIRFLPKKLSKL